MPAAVVLALSIVGAAAGEEPADPLGSLRGVQPPAPPAAAYNAIVADRRWLLALGKALFWDSQLGSDGQACATCHFHGGADPRQVNQLSPGLLARPTADDKFGGIFPAGSAGLTRGGFLDLTGRAARANLALIPSDFPLRQLADELDRDSAILYDSNDVVSSQGVFDGTFMGLTARVRFGRVVRDFCAPGTDDIFVIHAAGGQKRVRKVEPRNTPTVINAVFNFRNFWDGRANNVFNGVSVFGRRDILGDPAARVVKRSPAGPLVLQALELENMSAASQAVGPPNSSFEMACGGRGFPHIGRKLLPVKALRLQKVHASDSVFGTAGPVGRLAATTGKGLIVTYDLMVQRAFRTEWWSGAGKWRITPTGALVADATAGFTQKELNFSLFFGLAIDAYERTLISDQTRFDDFMDGDTAALTDQEQLGLALFQGKGRCVACHAGPELTKAGIHLLPEQQEEGLVERMRMGDGGIALYDNGFYNIGVRPTHEDAGLGGTDPYGNPLSFTRQYLDMLQGWNVPDRFQVNPCTFEVPVDDTDCTVEPSPDERVAVDGAFKTPGLRNVALTPPYFHNGGQATLHQVVRFYNRGGDVRSAAGTGDSSGSGPLGQSRPLGPGLGGSNLDPDITSLDLSEEEEDALVAFLLALTDRRVACHAAPFDHPELILPNGHKNADANGDGRADDARIRLPAVGRSGFAAGKCDPNRGDLFQQNLIGTGRMLTAVP